MGANVLADAGGVKAIPAKAKHTRKVSTTKFREFISLAESGRVVSPREHTEVKVSKRLTCGSGLGQAWYYLVSAWTRYSKND